MSLKPHEQAQLDIEAVRAAANAFPNKARLARMTGLDPQWLYNFRRGHISDPGYTRFFMLARVLHAHPGVRRAGSNVE